MMRANSHDSILGSEDTLEPTTQVVTPSTEPDAPMLPTQEPKQAQTPPDSGASGLGISVEETPRPNPSSKQDVEEEEPTPRPTVKSG